VAVGVYRSQFSFVEKEALYEPKRLVLVISKATKAPHGWVYVCHGPGSEIRTIIRIMPAVGRGMCLGGLSEAPRTFFTDMTETGDS